jgi:hypothetical protein
MTCNGIALQGLVLLAFSKLVNSVLSDLGAMSIKVTFLFAISEKNGVKSC